MPGRDREPGREFLRRRGGAAVWMVFAGLPATSLPKAINTAGQNDRTQVAAPSLLRTAERRAATTREPAGARSPLCGWSGGLDAWPVARGRRWRDGAARRRLYARNAGWPEAAWPGALGHPPVRSRIYDGVAVEGALGGRGKRQNLARAYSRSAKDSIERNCGLQIAVLAAIALGFSFEVRRVAGAPRARSQRVRADRDQHDRDETEDAQKACATASP